MAKVDEPKLPGWDEPPLPLQAGGTGPRRSLLQQVTLLHLMISLVYFAILFWAARQIMLADGYAERLLFGMMLGLGICLVGLLMAARMPRVAVVGWALFVVGYLTIMAVTTAFFAIPAFPILVGSIIYLGLRRRSNHQDALLWVLAVATERGMPLGPGIHALSTQLSGIYQVWTGALADLLRRGVPLPDALESVPRLIPRRSLLLIRTGWDSGSLALGLKEAIAARESRKPALHALAARFAYLGWLIAVAAFIVGFILYFIMPRFEAIFKDFGLDLPEATKVVLIGSHYVLDYAWVAVLGLLGALLYGLFAVLGPGEAGLPVVDRFFARRHAILILRALAIVVKAGRPIPPSLASLSQWYPTGWVRRKLAFAADDAGRGMDWVEALREAGLISSSDVGVLASAQRAGNLAWALRELAETGERRLADRLQVWSQWMFVAAMLLIGALVLLLAVAFFMPLVSLIERLA